MSSFAAMVQQRLADATASGGLSRSNGEPGPRALETGLSVVQHLTTTNAACAADENCKSVAAVLQVAQKGTPADARTALTRLQGLLRSLTAADSDVAADQAVQQFRRRLHLALDH